MKAMRGRIALQSTVCENSLGGFSRFAKHFGMRARPRVAL
jgi:hypothetical protein